MKTLVMVRDGTVKLRVPRVEERSDGTLWCNDSPLLNATGLGALPADATKALVRAKAWSNIPAGAWARMGENAGGLLVIESDEWSRRGQADRTRPGGYERAQIDALLFQANRLANGPSEDNVSGPISLRAEARRRLAQWRENYPAEAAEERADELRSLAEHEDHLAVGALTYDADGWISREDQNRRAAEHRTKADEYRRQARGVADVDD